MLETAIRKGELCALELGDVDLDAPLVTIPRGKGGRGRVIPIGPFASRALRAYLLLRAQHPLAAGPGYARDAKSELFLLAVTSFVAEDSFYEAAAESGLECCDLG
jgi:integrase